MDLADCCSKCGSNESPAFSPRYLAITACVSFVAGVAIVLLILFIIKLKRDKKMCFKRKEEPFKGKFEGASKKATFQVLKKHTLERSPGKGISSNEGQSEQEKTEEPETSHVEIVLNTETETVASEELTKQESECAENKHDENEKVYHGTKSNSSELEQNVSVDSVEEDKEHATVIKENAPESDILKQRDRSAMSSHLFEKSRGSSVYEHDDFVLQNANFRISALSNI
ncbi:uncharacterized protein LOC123528730 isoform X2 [Mercenaria mercenaria]|nr:uncharacterized protein LOC123528730 isoform X2 [Mercenaria mercenaria]XP_053377689.1 uncharacterized protein LOC123528730 isoform X2 [Mercenaria mercenaria]